ncbi:MAG: U32 family peptidase [Oscillospiraceae bacterium]
MAYAHGHGVRVHCTINTMPRGNEIVRLPEHLERLDDAGVDALIVADLGAFTLAGKYAPHCQRHISTQASISNFVTANAWYDLGASRVILARELSLEEIRTIREKTPPELEIRSLRTRRHVCQLFRAVPAEQLYDGPGRQPRRLCPALPLSLCLDGGKAPRRIFPH